MRRVTPEQLFLTDGDSHRSAVSLLDLIYTALIKSFDKKTGSAEIELLYSPAQDIRTYVLSELKDAHWKANFSERDGKIYIMLFI